LLQRSGKRPQEERRGCSGGKRNKMRLLLLNYNAHWRRVFRRELLLLYLEFCREENFPESKLSGFAPYSKYAEHLRKPVFWLRRYFV
jgi:hypothetical protein